MNTDSKQKGIEGATGPSGTCIGPSGGPPEEPTKRLKLPYPPSKLSSYCKYQNYKRNSHQSGYR